MNKFEKALDGGHNEFMEGKVKMNVEEIITLYPNGVHIDGFTMAENNNGTYAIFTFAEAPDVFCFGGDAITSACQKWINMCGSEEEANAELKAEGGAFAKFTRERTKSNHNYTKVSFAG